MLFGIVSNNVTSLHKQNMLIIYLFTGFAACRENSLRFPNSIVPDSSVFAGVYNKLRENGAHSSRHICSELANAQNLDEVESIVQSVERSPTQAQEKFVQLSVFHIQEYGELYCSAACILFIYRWCNAWEKEMKLGYCICVGG
jgi:hypothetical protein